MTNGKIGFAVCEADSLVIGHHYPDGNAVGQVLAIYRLAQALGMENVILFADADADFRWLRS